jgi:hypothetical protein
MHGTRRISKHESDATKMIEDFVARAIKSVKTGRYTDCEFIRLFIYFFIHSFLTYR